MKTTTKERIFFSYSRADQAFTMKLARELRAAGANLWLDQLDIEAGVRWDRAIEEALETSECLLVILSPRSVVSQNVMDEVSYALEEVKQIVPVLHQDCKIPFRLRRMQYIDFTGDYDKSFNQLLFALGLIDETPSGRMKALDIPAPPPEAAAPASSEPEAPAEDSSAQGEATAPTVARSRRRRGRVLRGVFSVIGIAASIVLGVVLAPLLGFRLSEPERVHPAEENHAPVIPEAQPAPVPADPAAPKAVSFTITPDQLSMERGVIEKMKLEFLDETGTPIEPEHLDRYEVQWRLSDPNVATVAIVSDTEVNVTGLKAGSGVITATVTGLEDSIPLVQAIPLSILISQEKKDEASQAYFTATNRRRDPSLSDTDILSDFEQVRSRFAEALDAEVRTVVDSTISRLQHAIQAFSAVEALDHSDTLTVLEKRNHWQAYFDQAFRESPATAQAQQKIDTLGEVEQRAATVLENTLFTCRRLANIQCATSQRTHAFEPGQTVYVSAKIHAPRSEKITVHWLNPSGEQIKQKKIAISWSPGYRIWDLLSGSVVEKAGRYEIRIYNSDDHLIGRHTFTTR